MHVNNKEAIMKKFLKVVGIYLIIILFLLGMAHISADEGVSYEVEFIKWGIFWLIMRDVYKTEYNEKSD
jgi:hypothetical protein